MNAQRNSGTSGTHAAGLALALAFVVLQCLDVTTYPLVNGDEALLNDAGWQLATTGRFRADVLALHRGAEDHYLWQVPGLGFAAAVSYELFGFGIWQTRLTGILFGGLGVWAIFAFVRSITPGTTGAWLAALSLFLWPDWMLTAKESRMDTPAIAALLLSSLLVVQSLRSGAPAGLGRLFLAGLCTSVATMFHSAALPCTPQHVALATVTRQCGVKPCIWRTRSSCCKPRQRSCDMRLSMGVLIRRWCRSPIH